MHLFRSRPQPRDICDGDVEAVITAFDCFAFTKKGKRIDKTESCVVGFDEDSVTILDSGGVIHNVISNCV